MAKYLFKQQRLAAAETIWGVAINGIPLKSESLSRAAFETPVRFLRSFPRGAYTTLRTDESHQVVAIEEHVQRLAQSLNILRSKFDINAKETDLTADLDTLRQPIILTIREAISNLETKCQEVDRKAYSYCIVVVIPLTGHHIIARASLITSTFRDPTGLHCVYYTRSYPLGKDSGWVRERGELQQSVEGQLNGELLLCSDDGTCLESSTSNFFVVAKRHIFTNNDNVLRGIAARYVIEACNILQIPISKTPPHLGNIEEWKEVFISNCIRIVQPVQWIRLPGKESQTIEFAVNEYMWTWKIRTQVWELMKRETYDVFLDARTFGRLHRQWNYKLEPQEEEILE
eukprot:jgi/Galph1/4335/GphlegSOOS_G2951.1